MIDRFYMSAEYLHGVESLIKQYIVETLRKVYGKSKRQIDKLCCSRDPPPRLSNRKSGPKDGPVIDLPPMKKYFGPKSPLRKNYARQVWKFRLNDSTLFPMNNGI